jgi:hypothetical protein
VKEVKQAPQQQTQRGDGRQAARNRVRFRMEVSTKRGNIPCCLSPRIATSGSRSTAAPPQQLELATGGVLSSAGHRGGRMVNWKRAPLAFLVLLVLCAAAFWTVSTLHQRSVQRAQQHFWDGIKAGDLNAVKSAVDDGYSLEVWNSDADRQYQVPPLNFTIGTSGSVQIIGYLLDHGVSPNVRTRDGRSPLFDAATLGRADIVDVLIKKGANVDVIVTDPNTAHDSSPLDLAAFRGHIEVVRLLLAAKADIRGADRLGGGLAELSPLALAAGAGHVEIAELLINAGAKVPQPIFLGNDKRKIGTLREAVCTASKEAYTRSLYNCRN